MQQSMMNKIPNFKYKIMVKDSARYRIKEGYVCTCTCTCAYVCACVLQVQFKVG